MKEYLNIDDGQEYVDEEYDYYDDDEYEEVEVDLSRYPTYPVKPEGVEYGIFISDILISSGLAENDDEVRELIKIGKITVNDEVVPVVGCILTEEDFWEGYVTIEKTPFEGRFIVLDL